MHTVTFTCSHCNNLMAVGGDQLGQQVRCPTCQNVVVAPLRDSDSAAEESARTIVINLVSPPPQESHESIFGETQDEDLFGTRPPKIEIPTEPAVASAGSSVVQLADYPPLSGLTQPPVAKAAAQEPSPAAETPPAAPPEEPWYVSATPAPPPPEPALPQWTDQPAPAEPAREPDWMNAPADHEDEVEPLRLSPPRHTIERRKGSNLMLSILAPYAVAMTIIAIWYFWKYQNYESSHHPLEMMGDVGRVDLPRKKDGVQTFKMPAPDLPLPDHLKVQLGAGPLTVGDLEITPLRIEQGRFKFHSVLKSGLDETRTTGKDGLILHLRLRNKSSQWAFCPTDPLFERSFDPQRHEKNSKPYTLIEVGQQLYFGGPLDQQNLGALKRMYVDGQDNDEEPLNPGEERVTVVCSNPMNDAVIPAVTGSKDVMTWRVHLRRGVTRFHGFDYSVTAVIGVLFTAGDIKKLAQN
jgi:hypothetical protein